MLTRTWIEQEGLKHVNFTLTNDGEKKIPVNIPTGWMEWTLAKCTTYNETHGGNMIAINIKDTKWMCIDIDDPKYEKMILKNYGEGWQTKSSTRKLPHLYRLRDPEDPGKNEIDKDGLGVDFKYDQMWESADGYIDITPGETAPVYEGFTVESKEVCSSKTVIAVPVPMTDEKEEYCMRVLNNIDVSYLEDRDTWVNIMYGMRNEGMSEDAMEKVSDRATKYKDGDVQAVMKGYDETRDKTITWSTVCMYSIKSNPDEHKKIRKSRVKSESTESSVSKSNHDVSTDKYLALKALELVNGEIVNVGDMLYVYDRMKGYWEQDHKGSHTRVMISNLVDDWLIDELEPLKGMSDAAKPYNKAREKVSSNSGINNIYSIFKDTIPQNNTIEFDDTKPYYFVWSCGKAYDFESHEFVVLKKEDYITMTTGYPYETYTEEDLACLQTLYREIHYDEGTYLPYMSMCVTACIGIQIEKLIVNTGGGGNGKGVVNELLSKMLGNYFYKGSVSTLQEPIKAEQANPALASMHLKRLTICTEPEPGKKLNQATLKTITGDGDINARQLYSSAMKVNNQNTLVMECNQLPNISGKMDNSVKRRIRAIPFNATYTDDPNDPDLLAGKPHVHPANLLYKKTLWQNSKRSALFEMLRRFAKEHGTGLLESETCKKRAAKYVSESDFAMVWFRDLYERVEDGEDVEPLPMAELFAEFKACDEYKNMDRDDKKYWTKKQLIEQLTEKLAKEDYNVCKVWSGKRYRSAIWNWRMIPED